VVALPVMGWRAVRDRDRGHRGVDRSARHLHSTIFFIIPNDFQMDLNLNWSKDGLLMVEHFQVKYGAYRE
jgi:hypothetical protein